ncbi:hypothetical protein BDN70DRAFT_885600 [Pholiota conissans]|uniref:Uncharacterized protein n=1 Tax=Pholiota conissans TaxID=109636 RepID=A0A9P5YS39_9AGAR|nr:hypothetical protein BDN70DRAFT_885600 [Pholiota conissans]
MHTHTNARRHTPHSFCLYAERCSRAFSLRPHHFLRVTSLPERMQHPHPQPTRHWLRTRGLGTSRIRSKLDKTSGIPPSPSVSFSDSFPTHCSPSLSTLRRISAPSLSPCTTAYTHAKRPRPRSISSYHLPPCLWSPPVTWLIAVVIPPASSKSRAYDAVSSRMTPPLSLFFSFSRAHLCVFRNALL